MIFTLLRHNFHKKISYLLLTFSINFSFLEILEPAQVSNTMQLFYLSIKNHLIFNDYASNMINRHALKLLTVQIVFQFTHVFKYLHCSSMIKKLVSNSKASVDLTSAWKCQDYSNVSLRHSALVIKI